MSKASMQSTSNVPTPEYQPTLTQKELGGRISMLGIKKANTRSWQLLILGVLAGLYIGLGGHVFLVALEQGAGKLVGGAVFSVGLVLVIVAGAELFTGNIILVVGTMTGLISLRNTFRNWGTVYLGNFIGAIGLAALVWYSGLLGTAETPNGLGTLAATVASAKLSLTFGQAFSRGILCNILVILAIIMATMCKDIISRIACCVLPIMVFVACGFEHCVANMYLIPLGLLVQGKGLAGQWTMFGNLIPVTLGNCVGGIFILAVHPNRIRQLVYLWRQRRGGSTA
jgi:formate/nitrite transporter